MDLFDQDPLDLAIGLLALMIVAWEVGVRVGLRSDGDGTRSRIEDAMLALLGLLLAFSFSAAAAKHEHRKRLAIDEASSIGDLATVGSMLAEPARSKLVDEIRAYLDTRIEMSRIPLGDAAEVPLLAQTRRQQAGLTRTIRDVIDIGNTPAAHLALINTFNAATTAFQSRRAALRDHIPSTVIIMLGLSAGASAFCLGRAQGSQGRREHTLTALFLVLIALVFFVTLDLEQPRRGIVRVPTWALENVRGSLDTPEPSPHR